MNENNNKKENNENGRDEIRLGLPEFNSRQTQKRKLKQKKKKELVITQVLRTTN